MGDTLTFRMLRRPAFVVRAVAWIGFPFAFAMVGLIATSWSQGTLRTYRCDHAGGACTDEASGRAVALLGEVTSIEPEPRPFRTMGATLGVKITRHSPLSPVFVCRSETDSGGASRFSVAADMKRFVANASAPALRFSCTEGQSDLFASLRFVLGAFIWMFLGGAFGLKRGLRAVEIDRKARVVRLRYGAVLPVPTKLRVVPFADLARLAVQRFKLKNGSEQRLEMFLADEAAGIALEVQPDDDAGNHKLYARKREVEAFMGATA